MNLANFHRLNEPYAEKSCQHNNSHRRLPVDRCQID